MGVAYYAIFLRWFEAGRTECLRAHGVVYAEAERALGIRLPVVEVTARYKQPARYDEEIDIECRVAHVGQSSLRFDYRIVREGVLLAEGHTVHACIDDQGKVRRLPDAFVQLAPNDHVPV